MMVQKTHPRAAGWWLALFFVALAVLGLATTADYGQPWDEPWEQDILRMNLNQYAAVLGNSTRLELRSTMQGPESGLIADSIEKDHGECAYYPVAWLVTNNGLTDVARMYLWHGWTWLLFMTGAAALWLICRRIGLGRLLSCAATLMLFLTPRFFAEGHYNNKDIVLFTLTLLTVWQGLRLMDQPNIPRALLFALFGAATANTKVIGVALWGLIALFALGYLLRKKRMNRRAWCAVGVCIVSFCAFYALLTPAMWSDPLGYLLYTFKNATAFTRWENHLLFRGVIYRLELGDVLPRFYLPYMIVSTTPYWILLLFAVGLGCTCYRLIRQRRAAFEDRTTVALTLCMLLWLIPLLVAILTRATVYNGWRHFYFLYAPMLVIAAYGLLRIAQVLRNHRTGRMLCTATPSVCMAVTGVSMAIAHPFEYVYYGPLTTSPALAHYVELDYWNVSALNTLQALLQSTSGTVRITGAEVWSQTGLEAAAPLLSAEDQARVTLLPQADATADYVLSNRTYAELSAWSPEPGMSVVAQSSAYGTPLMTIFQRVAP